MQATIEVSGLRKRFGSTLALDGMSFTVQPGQVTGFVGPNGAGKSTTMRVILGLDKPDAGNALIGGRALAAASFWSRASNPLGSARLSPTAAIFPNSRRETLERFFMIDLSFQCLARAYTPVLHPVEIYI